MKYWLHPEAENDLRGAAEFYSTHADAALSQALLAEFEHAMHLLLEHPRLGPPWRSNMRRYVMRRFPYSVIYSVSGEELRIFAVAHHSRRPGFWRNRR